MQAEYARPTLRYPQSKPQETVAPIEPALTIPSSPVLPQSSYIPQSSLSQPTISQPISQPQPTTSQFAVPSTPSAPGVSTVPVKASNLKPKSKLIVPNSLSSYLPTPSQKARATEEAPLTVSNRNDFRCLIYVLIGTENGSSSNNCSFHTKHFCSQNPR